LDIRRELSREDPSASQWRSTAPRGSSLGSLECVRHVGACAGSNISLVYYHIINSCPALTWCHRVIIQISKIFCFFVRVHVHPHPEILFRCLFRTRGGDGEIFPGTRRPRTAPNPYSGTSMSISTGFARAQESCHPIRYQSKFTPVTGTQNTRLLMRTAFRASSPNGSARPARVPATPNDVPPPIFTSN
jgi:hypothetical protein